MPKAGRTRCIRRVWYRGTDPSGAMLSKTKALRKWGGVRLDTSVQKPNEAREETMKGKKLVSRDGLKEDARCRGDFKTQNKCPDHWLIGAPREMQKSTHQERKERERSEELGRGNEGNAIENNRCLVPQNLLNLSPPETRFQKEG